MNDFGTTCAVVIGLPAVFFGALVVLAKLESRLDREPTHRPEERLSR